MASSTLLRSSNPATWCQVSASLCDPFNPIVPMLPRGKTLTHYQVCMPASDAASGPQWLCGDVVLPQWGWCLSAQISSINCPSKAKFSLPVILIIVSKKKRCFLLSSEIYSLWSPAFIVYMSLNTCSFQDLLEQPINLWAHHEFSSPTFQHLHSHLWQQQATLWYQLQP